MKYPQFFVSIHFGRCAKTFTNAQTEMSALYASFESIHTSSLKQTNKNPNTKQRNTTQKKSYSELVSNTSEGEDHLFHGCLLPDSKTE